MATAAFHHFPQISRRLPAQQQNPCAKGFLMSYFLQMSVLYCEIQKTCKKGRCCQKWQHFFSQKNSKCSSPRAFQDKVKSGKRFILIPPNNCQAPCHLEFGIHFNNEEKCEIMHFQSEKRKTDICKWNYDQYTINRHEIMHQIQHLNFSKFCQKSQEQQDINKEIKIIERSHFLKRIKLLEFFAWSWEVEFSKFLILLTITLIYIFNFNCLMMIYFRFGLAKIYPKKIKACKWIRKKDHV